MTALLWRALRCVLLVALLPSATALDPLVGRDGVVAIADRGGEAAFDSIASQLAADPYNPGSFAWGWQYHARGCLIMYNVTGERKWLDWAVAIADHFLEYSDVNGDGIPAWGNYNETWGNSRYEFREYTVWDGVIGLPIIEAAKIIRGDELLSRNTTLSARADSYVQLITEIINRHHRSWTQVGEDQGYYWDDPYMDVGPIVNRFTALGRVELVLGDVTGNETFYEKPRQMANYMVSNMRHDRDDDLYTWEYWYGEGGSEDISHGAIELEFLIMANRRGLLDAIHLDRLANTYLQRIWQVPEVLDGRHLLAMRVDGDDPKEYDYSGISRNWILLAPYEPLVYECQRIVFGILHEISGVYPSSVSLLGLAQIPLMADALASMGIDAGDIRVIDLPTLQSLLSRAEASLNATVALGSQAAKPREYLQEARSYAQEDRLANASIAMGLIMKAWDLLGVIAGTGEMLAEVRLELEEAERLGANVTAVEGNLSVLSSKFAEADTTGALDGIMEALAPVELEVSRLVAESLIKLADQVVAEAKERGIDTSRHEIFLGRAHEQYEKGNYGSAKQFTEYPLRLREELPEHALAPWMILLLSLLGIIFIGRPRDSTVLQKAKIEL
jgi:hypothetical protein